MRSYYVASLGEESAFVHHGKLGPYLYATFSLSNSTVPVDGHVPQEACDIYNVCPLSGFQLPDI